MKNYIIYCRKSSDESTNKQSDSIPQQLERCKEKAKQEKLNIIEVITEEKTAKRPHARKKFSNIIERIEKGEVEGILSYAPDRLARNMLDAGMLIDFIERDLVDLKFTSFDYENNNAGKFMLSLMFSMSKQYSDKLGEDVARGNKKKHSDRKYIGDYKFGYTGENSKYLPDGNNFNLMKEAFRLKIEENHSYQKISEFLKNEGFIRKFKNGRTNDVVTPQMLSNIFRDSFYYGVYTRNGIDIDLRENTNFEPLISEEDFFRLQDLIDNKEKNIVSIKKKENLFPVKNGLVKCVCGSTRNLGIPNKSRFIKKLEKLKKENPEAELEDVLPLKNITLDCQNKDCEHKGVIKMDVIDEKIKRYLKEFKVTKEDYEEYKESAKEELDEKYNKIDEKITYEKRRLTFEKKKLRDLIKNRVSQNLDNEEVEIYKVQKNEISKKISYIEEKIKEIESSELEEVANIELFLNILGNAYAWYKTASFQEKHDLTEILFLNIITNKEKPLQVDINDDLKGCFSDKILNGAQERI